MENFKIFAVVFLVLTFFYFTQSVPLCRVDIVSSSNSSTPAPKAIYTSDEVLKIQSYNISVFNVRGQSMYPTIKDNSQCICVKKDNYKLGDIVAFVLHYKGENQAIMHRIYSINNSIIITKGDYNNFTDPKITEKNIICSVPYVPRFMVFK